MSEPFREADLAREIRDELVELLDGDRAGSRVVAGRGSAGGGHAAPISATACSGISTQVGRLRVS